MLGSRMSIVFFRNQATTAPPIMCIISVAAAAFAHAGQPRPEQFWHNFPVSCVSFARKNNLTKQLPAVLLSQIMGFPFTVKHWIGHDRKRKKVMIEVEISKENFMTFVSTSHYMPSQLKDPNLMIIVTKLWEREASPLRPPTRPLILNLDLSGCHN